MSGKPVTYNAWLHIEGVDVGGDVLEGDSYHEPRSLGSFGTRDQVEAFANEIEGSLDRVRELESALREAASMLETLRRYLPKPINHQDIAFRLGYVLTDVVNPALAPAKGG